MRKKFLLMTFLTLLFTAMGTSVLRAQVAKVGNTEYATIDEAIANWGNNTTLTLLADVTLSDVIQLSSTEYHILDLGIYTMTAASNKDAIKIVNNGRSSASYALDIKADATNPGGITASGKTIVVTTGKSGVKDRPIIRFYNGVFNGSNVVKHSGSNGTNCPQFQFHGGVFNGDINTNRSLNQFYGGTFNGQLWMSVDSSAYTLIAGGTFKNLSNLMGSALNSGKFTIGSAKGVYDKEVYIDDNGNYVIAATEPAQGIEADVAKNPGTNDYLAYSKVATEGQLGYTDVYTAIDKNKSGTITVYVDELDLNNTGFTGTIVVPKGSTITITNAPGNLVVKDEEGNVLEPNANSYTAPVFSGEGTAESPYSIDDIDDLNNLRNKVNEGEAYEDKYFELTSDITLTDAWTPIGNGARSSKTYTGYSFKGTFDGGNKTISGLTITSTSGADAAIGLFGIVDGGTVKNLNLTDVNINVASSNLAGAAIGMMLNGATADNITVSGAIIGHDGVGGIVGRLIIDGTISNCINNASVTSSYGGIGGIVGKAYYEDDDNTSTFASVIKCTNNGTITAPMYVGGIVGLARANVTECVNNRAVVGGTQTGGIIGQLIAAGEVSANENKAKISGTNHLGGIIGDYSQSSAYTYNNVLIANNTNRGEVSATQCAAIMGCNNIDGFTAMTATGNVSYYYVEGLELFGNPEDMVIDGTNKFIIPVAQVGEQTFYTFADAAAAAQAGSEIILLANIEGDITVPANVTLNGNGFAISGGIFAEGDITFAGVTKAADFDANVVNTEVNIPAGASLQLTGPARLVIGHGATFNITGTIEDAKTADKATLVPSLKIAAGASITGNGVIFNVNNAYIVANANTTSKNSNANGTLDFNINNSIWEQTGVLAFYVPTSGMDPVVNFELKNSVLTTTSHLVFSVTKGEIVIDNSLVNQGTSRQIENRSTMTIKNGAVVNGAVATSSNAINPGTIIVENATYAVTGEFSGAAEGTGTLIINKDANVSVGSIKAGANVVVDAEGMAAGDNINFTANLSQFTGTLSVINNDNLEAKIVGGNIILVVKPVAKIGETEYATLQAALQAAAETEELTTIQLLAGTRTFGNVKFPATLKNVTIVGADNKATIIKDSKLYSADGNAVTYKGITFDGIVFDNSSILFTGARNGEVVYEDWTIKNCDFRNLQSTDGIAAIHFNLAADETIKNFTFEDNTITNVTSPSNTASGLRLNYVTGNVVIKDNETNNVAFNAVQIINSVVDNFTFEGNILRSNGSSLANLYNVTGENIVITKNQFLVANEDQKGVSNIAYADVSGNYWGGGAPTNLPAGVVYSSYYTTVESDGTLGGLVELPQGNNFTGYTGVDAIWGEVWGNAKESFVIKVLNANGENGEVMGTTSLNDIGGIIDGDVNVTWNIKLDAASNTDEYWTMNWTKAPSIDNMPAKVELWVDGVKVSGGNVVLNGPDEINKIYAAVTDEAGKIYSYHKSIADAITAINNTRSVTPNVIALLRDTDETVTLPAGITLNLNDHTAPNVSVPVAQIGETPYYTLAEAVAAAQSGATITLLNGEHELPLFAGKELTFKGESKEGVIVNDAPDATTQGWNGSTFHFENLTAKGATANYHGLANGVVTVTYKDCNINGLRFLYATEGVSFDGCAFNAEGVEHSFWTYGASNVTVNNCTFTYTDRAVNCYSENGANHELHITFSDCDFEYAGPSDEPAGAVEINSSSVKSMDVAFTDDCTAPAKGAMWFISQWDSKHGANTVVEVDGVVVWTAPAKIGETKYATLQEALNAAAAGTGNITVEILDDIDLTNVDWNPVTVSAPGYPVVTVEGNGKTITGLNDMLFAGTWAGNSGLIINDLTIANSNIVHDENDSAGNIGVGAFIGFPQASATITLNKCHLVNSTVNGGHWTGGLIGMAGGYNGNDGPVFMNLTIKDCSVTGSIITGKGSCGGIIGHGSCAAWTAVNIQNTTVSGNTVTSTGSSTNKAGAVMGTIGAAGQPTTANGVTLTGGAMVDAIVSGNTVKSNNEVITTIYGRQGTDTGILELNGGTYDNYPIEQNVAYAKPAAGLMIEQNEYGTYGLVPDPAYGKVAMIGETYYETLSAAFAAVTNDEQTVVILSDVTEKLEGAYLRGNITTKDGTKVTITLTNQDWVPCPYTFILGENITLNVPALFYYAGGAQINGTVVAGAYYQRYANSKLTINEPGSMKVTTETFIVRYMDADPNAGIYIIGDNNDETIGLEASVIYFYQGMINAKNADIKVGTYWQTNESDNHQGSANLVLDNSNMTVTVNEHNMKATANSTVTLTNGSNVTVAGGYQGVGVSIDATSSMTMARSIFVSKINNYHYTSLQEAATAAQDGETIELLWQEGQAPIAMNASLYGNKNVTITGTATVDWSKGFLFVGRGGEGDATLTFDNAILTSASNSASTGIHVSGREKNTNDKYDGTVIIKNNSTIELDYLINKGTMTLDESTLTVKNGFSVGGRPASETESGQDATATITLNNGSKVVVNNHNGMGLGYEAIGVMYINSGSTFETTQSFLITAKGTMNVNGGNVKTVGTLTNNGTINVTGKSTLNIEKLEGSSIDLNEGAIVKNSTVGGDAYIAGNVIFRGDNTFNMITDYGDYYSQVTPSMWTVEAGASLTLTKTDRYGLGYGDKVTVYGEIEDEEALTARASLTDEDASVNMYGGLVGMTNSAAPNAENSFTATNAYLIFGVNGDKSFGNKPGNYYGNYTFTFNNSVVTANGFKFYEDNGTSTVKFSYSDLLVNGVLMTNDASSNFTFENSVVLSMATSNGTDDKNQNAGVMTLTNTQFTYSAAFTNVGTLNIGESSTFTAPSVVNNGAINFTALSAKLDTDTEGLTIVDQVNNPDYKVVYKEGAYQFVEKVYVAQVDNGDKFETLIEAVNAVEDGGTITLIANETFTENNRYNNGGWWDGLGYSGDKSFTIDLANFTISQDGALNDYLMWFKNDGAKANTITLKNGTLDAGTTAYCALATSSSNTNKITINTENIEFIGNNSGGAVLKIRGGAELNVNAGTKITGTDSYVGIECYSATVNIYDGTEIYQNGTSSYNGCLVGVSGNGTVNVYGGYGKGVSGGFIAMTSGGTINVAGGEWIANTDGTYANDNKSVLVAQSANGARSIVNVTGGIFRGGYNCYGNAVGDAQINISGGNFNEDPSTYVVAKYKAVPKADGTFDVIQVSGTQTREFAYPGWYWFSTYIDFESGEEGLDELQEQLGDNAATIKGQKAFTNYQYYNGVPFWTSALTSISASEMYMIKTTNKFDEEEQTYEKVPVSLEGDFVDYENYEITIHNGWNWIGYPLNTEVSVRDALAGFTPAIGDQIKGKTQGSTSTYMNNNKWVPNFNMIPGEGYMYHSTASENKTLTYRAGNGGTQNAKTSVEDNHWIVDEYKYSNNMTVIAMLSIDGEIVKGNYEVAAFANGECRGSARPIYIESIDAYVLFMTIHGDEVEELTFMYYDIDKDTEYELSNVMNYSNDAIVGTIDNPYIFSMNILGIGENSIDNINIYPNPTTTDREINLQAICDKVEVFNALGVKVAEYHNVDTLDALETAGIYVIRITNDNAVKHCRLVVK